MSDPERVALNSNRTSLPAGDLSESMTECRELAPIIKPIRQAGNLLQAEAMAKEFVGKSLTNDHTGMQATVSNKSLGKMLSRSAVKKSTEPMAHAVAVANVDELFRSAVLGQTQADRENNVGIRAIHRFYAPMEFAEKIYRVKLTVKELKEPSQGNRIYTLEALEITTPARK